MPLRDNSHMDDETLSGRPLMDIIPERFDADSDSQQARNGAHTRLILTIALALLALAALGVGARHIFFDGPIKDPQAGIPVIHADDKPIKTKPGPDEQGGMDVPNRDKLVYDRMNNATDAEPQRESLLPPPEQPQAPPAAQPRAPSIKPAFPAPPPHDMTPAAPPPTAAAPAPPAPPAAQAMAPMPAAPAKPATPVVTAAMPAPAPPVPAPAPAPAKPAAVAVAKPVPPPAPRAPAPPPPAPPPVAAAAVHAAAGGRWVVQLGALKSEGDARAEWGRIHGANKDVLGSLSSDIIRVDLGAKGIFWRLRAGPLDEAQARTICASLAKRNQGCILAKK